MPHFSIPILHPLVNQSNQFPSIPRSGFMCGHISPSPAPSPPAHQSYYGPINSYPYLGPIPPHSSPPPAHQPAILACKNGLIVKSWQLVIWPRHYHQLTSYLYSIGCFPSFKLMSSHIDKVGVGELARKVWEQECHVEEVEWKE